MQQKSAERRLGGAEWLILEAQWSRVVKALIAQKVA
jgi:hypothetical protein